MVRRTKRKGDYNSILENAFLKAIIDSDIELVRSMICESYLVLWDENFMSPLHIAVNNGHLDLVSLLLSSGACVNILDNNRMTPLHFAAAEGHLEVAKLLINAGVLIDQLNYDRMSALHISAQNNHIDLVRLLVQHNANLYQRDSEGMTPIHLAIYNNSIETVLLFLNIMDKYFLLNNVGLHSAAASGHIAMIKLFLTLEADINCLNHNCITAIDIALRLGFVDITRLLIDKGAQFSRPNGSNEIRAAVERSDIDMLRLLLEKDVSSEHLYKGSISLLHIAIKNLDIDSAKLLIEQGTDLSVSYRNKVPSLFLAIRSKSLEITKLLLENGADMNELDYLGSNALHIASANGCTQIIQLLLEYGADMECPNTQGSTALRIAYLREHYGAAILLIQNGANIYDIYGNVIFEYMHEINEAFYTVMYNKYLACRIYYKHSLRIKDKNFINSGSFSTDVLVHDIMQITYLRKRFVDVLQCITSDIPAIKQLNCITDLLSKIATFFTPLEARKIVTSHDYELNRVVENLEYNGYIVQDVEKDGNCFFRAVALALGQPENSHNNLRERTARYIENNSLEFTNFSENLDFYVRSISQPGVWADNISIQALSDDLHININIHRLHDNSITQITPRTSGATHTISLIYTGNHYMTLVDQNSIEQSYIEQESFKNITEVLFDDHALSPQNDTIEQEIFMLSVPHNEDILKNISIPTLLDNLPINRLNDNYSTQITRTIDVAYGVRLLHDAMLNQRSIEEQVYKESESFENIIGKLFEDHTL